MVRSTFTYKSIKIKERFPVLLKKYSRLRQKIVTFNPLLHFQNCKLAQKTFGFRHQGDPPNPPAKFEHQFAGGSGGPPDAENRRFSELIKRTSGMTEERVNQILMRH